MRTSERRNSRKKKGGSKKTPHRGNDWEGTGTKKRGPCHWLAGTIEENHKEEGTLGQQEEKSHPLNTSETLGLWGGGNEKPSKTWRRGEPTGGQEGNRLRP